VSSDSTPRVALITGAARGIGEETAVVLAEKGVAVACLDIDQAGLQETVERVERADGVAWACTCDIRDAGAVSRCVASMLEELGRLDVVVNNAVKWTPAGPLVELTEERWHADLEMLLSSYRLVASATIPHMSAGGSIVNLSSVHGLFASSGWGTYDIAKAAILQLTRVLAVEVGRDGIRVNAVAPGIIASERDLVRYEANPDVRHRNEMMSPLQRMGTPRDVANVVAFLAGPESTFVTGQTIVVDGGMTTVLQLTAVQEYAARNSNLA
jgi:NAD(P)-dependent dehydrogenase (short-subunit alcohol dehydrogenase family)